MTRILVTGSRYWTDWDVVNDALARAWNQLGRDPHAILVHGAAAGLDTIAARIWSRRFGPDQVEGHPAQWKAFGKRAGVLRNQVMVDLGADICLGFPLTGPGTRDCMARAEAAGIHVLTFTAPRKVPRTIRKAA